MHTRHLAHTCPLDRIAIIPRVSLTVTVLPPIPAGLLRMAAGARRASADGDDLARDQVRDQAQAAAAECADYCERVVAGNSMTPTV